jgi:hypothetical protein
LGMFGTIRDGARQEGDGILMTSGPLHGADAWRAAGHSGCQWPSRLASAAFSESRRRGDIHGRLTLDRQQAPVRVGHRADHARMRASSPSSHGPVCRRYDRYVDRHAGGRGGTSGGNRRCGRGFESPCPAPGTGSEATGRWTPRKAQSADMHSGG